jgi:VanZ family protein
MPISHCNCAGFRLFLGLVLVITTYLSLTPQPAPLPDVVFADKWAHALTYLLLAFLVDASWPEHRFDIRKWGTLFAYGLLIELIQSQIPNRLFSLGDLAANAAGIAVYGWIALPLVRRRLSRSTQRR